MVDGVDGMRVDGRKMCVGWRFLYVYRRIVGLWCSSSFVWLVVVTINSGEVWQIDCLGPGEGYLSTTVGSPLINNKVGRSSLVESKSMHI